MYLLFNVLDGHINSSDTVLIGLPDGELTDQPNMSDNPVVMYYISDGVYGSFSTLRYDHTAEDQSSHSM
ncbi:hypothetical protein DPMN_080400 [Dreissena polymorpha]|uniref:Uncharacterized protein n=1 Tax=Dreissena polymorpha TaxID=45954 RepID=A0A9D4BRW2_DREPO|nr:hypothetical protein DPMN_080400 [Dreissena polymorpha]